jgi:hypothetical protein
MMIAYASSLKDLDTWLGDGHNLVVLRDKIAAEPEFYGKDREIGERIYDAKPSQFVRRMKHLWNAWKSQPKSFKTLQKQKKGKQSKTQPQRAA